jgi:predicted DNA-binding protein
MKTSATRNFHVPLSDETYGRLKSQAQRQRKPATQLVKQAVEYWLDEQDRLALHEEIAGYAAATAGSADDLDASLEAAGIDSLLDQDRSA